MRSWIVGERSVHKASNWKLLCTSSATGRTFKQEPIIGRSNKERTSTLKVCLAKLMSKVLFTIKWWLIEGRRLRKEWQFLLWGHFMCKITTSPTTSSAKSPMWHLNDLSCLCWIRLVTWHPGFTRWCCDFYCSRRKARCPCLSLEFPNGTISVGDQRRGGYVQREQPVEFLYDVFSRLCWWRYCRIWGFVGISSVV